MKTIVNYTDRHPVATFAVSWLVAIGVVVAGGIWLGTAVVEGRSGWELIALPLLLSAWATLVVLYGGVTYHARKTNKGEDSA